MKSEKTTKREQVYKKLRDAIVFGDLNPGEKLVERELSKMFNIGTTPIREAIRQLESEGLIEVFPNRGALVKKITLKDAVDAYEVAAILEGYAAKIAAKKATEPEKKKLRLLADDVARALKAKDYRTYLQKNERFHDALHQIAGNSVLSKQINAVRNQFFRFLGIIASLPGHSEKALRAHEEILKAIERGDPEKAGQCIKRHLREVKADLSEIMDRIHWI